jgi:hypothetical protein
MTGTTVATLPPPPAWARTTSPIEQGREFSAGFGDPTPHGCPRYLVELVQCEYLDDETEPAAVRRTEPRLHIAGECYSPAQAAHLLNLIQAALNGLGAG